MPHAAPSPNSLRAQRREKNQQRQAQALVQAHPQVGATIHQALLDLGGSNPDGGVKAILETLVELPSGAGGSGRAASHPAPPTDDAPGRAGSR